jgi:hypothetical protein
LRSAEIGECILQGMKVSIRSEAFYRFHFPSIAFDSQHEAREHGLAVQNNGAGTALSEFAPVFGSGVAQILPKHFQQSFVWSKRHINNFAVQRDSNVSCFLGFGG